MKFRQVAGIFYAILSLLAGSGLFISMLVHLLLWVGVGFPMRVCMVLHTGLFGMWPPFLAGLILIQGAGITISIPSWWPWIARRFFAYILFHFALSVFYIIFVSNHSATRGVLDRFPGGLLFSAGWIFFYGTATVFFARFWQGLSPPNEGYDGLE